MDFTLNEYSATRTIEKLKILEAILELPAKTAPRGVVSKIDQIIQNFDY